MEANLQILPLKLADLDTVVVLDNAVFDPSARDDREVYRDRLVLYPEGCFKLISDGEVIGYITSEVWSSLHDMPINRKASLFHDPKGTMVMVSAFGVHPKFQGQGNGSFFLKHFIDTMRERGFGSIVLRPASTAVSLYARFGFVKIGEGEDKIEKYSIVELRLK